MIKGFLAALGAAAMLVAQNAGLKILVISGEGGVNIIQQKTAVAPVIEVRDRNNLPVAGASVTFSMGGGGATFGGASSLTVTTNAVGQATAASLTPTTSGAIHINVAAAFQGQSATAAITQTNVMTAAQAAGAAGGGAGGGGGSAAGAGAAGGGAGGGLSMTTIAIIGGAVAGGAVAAVSTGVIGGGDEAFVTIRGQVFSTIKVPCSSFSGGNPSPDCLGPPVQGAIVSTTLDGVTATSAGDGNFDLVTTVLEKDAHCREYSIRITAAGFPVANVPNKGFASSNSSHRQVFSLSPQSPEFMNGGC